MHVIDTAIVFGSQSPRLVFFRWTRNVLAGRHWNPWVMIDGHDLPLFTIVTNHSPAVVVTRPMRRSIANTERIEAHYGIKELEP
jgi:hypothetical protein